MNPITYSLVTPMQPASRAVSTVLRLGLGVVWLVAGLLKVNDPDGMVRSVRAFRILPDALVQPIAYGVPFLEIALGMLLVVGLAVRLSAVVSAVMFAVYIAAIASAAARGLRIDCGCFSSGGDLAADAPTHYTSELIRDSLLLAAAGLLAWRPSGYLAVDCLLDQPVNDLSGSTADGFEVEEDTVDDRR
ncbi:MauE/DoxX family redox-associated membrane protein [Frankia sp. CcWB3]